MHVNGETVTFEECDLHFLKTFGLQEATRMVGDYRAEHSLPFVYDTYQLSKLLSLPRNRLFAMSRRPEASYRPVYLSKKSGGLRRLHVPNDRLRTVQRRILHCILLHHPVSCYATAYRRYRSLKDNATPHCGKTYLLKMDIKDFFGSIRFEQVYNAAFNTRFFPIQIGAMLTSLCCYQERLPQGAPTSPALSNLVMRHFDHVMGEWCDKHGIAFTRYCDDITFSSDRPLYAAFVKAKSLLSDMGFELNDKKTCFVTNASRKTVTGLIVNGDCPTVSREYRRRLRQELYYVEKYGVADAILRGRREAFIENGEPQVYRYLDHLEGCVLYVIRTMKEQSYFVNARIMLRRMRVMQEEDEGYTPFFGFC